MVRAERIGVIEFAAKNIHFFIGPEGDFTPKEIEFLLEKKCVALTFGETRLRTETAGIYLMSVLNFKLNL